MARGIGYRDRARVDEAEQGELRQLQPIDDGLDIADECVERVVGDTALGQADPPAVVPDESRPAASASYQRLISGICHSSWTWLMRNHGMCTNGVPSPIAQ